MHPLLQVRLHAGDALYIPPIWWHLITSLPPPGASQRGRTIAVTLQGDFLASDVSTQLRQLNAKSRTSHPCPPGPQFLGDSLVSDVSRATPHRSRRVPHACGRGEKIIEAPCHVLCPCAFGL